MDTRSNCVTKLRKCSASYKWTIENLEEFCEYYERQYYRQNFCSPIFNNNDGSKWQLSIFFEKDDEYEGYAMTPALQFKGNDRQENIQGIRGEMNFFYSFNSGSDAEHHSHRFIHNKDSNFLQFNDGSKRYSPCSSERIEGIRLTELPSTISLSVDLIIGCIESTTVQRSPQPIIEELPNSFSALADDEEFADVTVAVEDSEFRAHKAVLAARSSVFRTMLSSEMREKEENRIVFTDVTAMAWKAFQQFLYTNALHHPENYSLPLLFELLMLSDKYDVRALSESVEVELLQKMSKENVLEICEVLEKYEMPQVRAAAVKIITQNWEEMKKDRRLISWMASGSELAVELFGKLNVN